MIRRSKSLRCHRIDFGDPRASESTLGLGPDIDEDAWQFEISKSLGRIHGYFVTSVFYVVWLDPKHELYPKPR